MIIINGNQILSSEALSERDQAVLSLIYDGKSWFDWQCGTNSVMEAKNAGDLMLRIAFGLHGTSVVNFKSFKSDLRAFLNMEDADLLGFAKVQFTEDDNNVHLGPMLEKYELTSYEDLAWVPIWLDQYNLLDRSWFQGLSFSDTLALYKIVKSPIAATAKMKEEAARYAAMNAPTAAEFVSLYQFYIAVARQLRKNMRSEERWNEVTLIGELLNAPTNSLIYGVSVGEYEPGEAWKKGLITALKGVKYIGCNNKAGARLNLALNFTPVDLQSVQIETNAVRLLQQFQSEMINDLPIDGAVGQDGSFRLFVFPNTASQIVLQLHQNGQVTLDPLSIYQQTPQSTSKS